MKPYLLTFAAAALAGVLAASSGAQATGLYDNDDVFSNIPTRADRSEEFAEYCDRYPRAELCREYREDRYYEKRHRPKAKAHNYRCRQLIRAAGKRNVVKVFARNSAMFAWRRETRAVHGSEYANWNNARGANITCTLTGILFSCTARATPCQY